MLDKNLLPSKAFYFFFFSALGSIFPYLSLFFKQLHLSPKQTGLLVGLRPLVQCITVPVWGLLADKTNIRKLSLLVGIIGWLLTYMSITVVETATSTSPSCLRSLPNSPERNSLYNNTNKTWSKLNLSLRHAGVYLSGKNRTSKSQGSFEQQSIDKLAFANRPFAYTYDNIGNRTLLGQYDPGRSRKTDLFLVFLLIIALGNIISAPAQTMANIATLQALSKETFKYGQQRLFGSIGWGMAAFIVGSAVGLSDTSSSGCDGRDAVDYTPCFFVFGAMMTCAFIAASFMKLTAKAEDHGMNLPSNMRKHFDLITVYLLVTAAFCGFVLGLTETFLFWHLHNIGGTQMLFSLITGINSLSEMFGFFFSPYFLERVGPLNVIVVGLFGATAQMLCYGMVRNPWLVLSVEILKALTVSCTWSALLSYIGLRSGSVATLQTILHALFWGFGHACGGIIGGLFVHAYGAAKVFLAVAVVSAFNAFLFFFITTKKASGCCDRGYDKVEDACDSDVDAETEIE